MNKSEIATKAQSELLKLEKINHKAHKERIHKVHKAFVSLVKNLVPFVVKKQNNETKNNRKRSPSKSPLKGRLTKSF